MSFEQISYLSQTIAAVAVVVSLIYAALQFRIYTKAAHEARLIAASSDVQEFRRLIASDGDCARILLDGFADLNQLDRIEQQRFDFMMQLVVTQVIYLTRFKDIPSEVTVQAIWGQPGVRQWWATARAKYTAHVVNVMDARFAASGAP